MGYGELYKEQMEIKCRLSSSRKHFAITRWGTILAIRGEQELFYYVQTSNGTIHTLQKAKVAYTVTKTGDVEPKDKTGKDSLWTFCGPQIGTPDSNRYILKPDAFRKALSKYVSDKIPYLHSHVVGQGLLYPFTTKPGSAETSCNFMNATEAKYAALQAKDSAYITQKSKILAEIKQKAESGHLETYFYEPLNADVEAYLKKEGFSVSTSFHRNETTVTVSWA